MPTEQTKRTLQKFSKRIGLRYKDISLLSQALTHRSYAYECQNLFLDNEKLEFLGDSVLGLAISEFLYKSFPDENEGYLAKIKAVVVSERVLAKVAKQIGIGDAIMLGRGEELSGGRERSSILADTMEAIIGACFLDSGFKKSRDFVIKLFHNEIQEIVAGKNRYAFRTELQEFVQKKLKTSPVYTLIHQEGPDNNKTFTMQVSILDYAYGSGTGRTKKDACQKAAQEALKKLHIEIEKNALPTELKNNFKN